MLFVSFQLYFIPLSLIVSIAFCMCELAHMFGMCFDQLKWTETNLAAIKSYKNAICYFSTPNWFAMNGMNRAIKTEGAITQKKNAFVMNIHAQLTVNKQTNERTTKELNVQINCFYLFLVEIVFHCSMLLAISTSTPCDSVFAFFCYAIRLSCC